MLAMTMAIVATAATAATAVARREAATEAGLTMAIAAATGTTAMVTATTVRRLHRHARSSGALRAARRTAGAMLNDEQPDITCRPRRDTLGTGCTGRIRLTYMGWAGCKLPRKSTRSWVMMNGQGVSLTSAQLARDPLRGPRLLVSGKTKI